MAWRLLCAVLIAAVGALVPWVAADPAPAAGGEQRLTQAVVVDAPDLATPPVAASGVPARLPFTRRTPAGIRPGSVWVGMRIELAVAPQGFQAVLLPYLYGGGQVWLDGALLGEIPVTTASAHVRWERPHLLAIAPGRLHAGVNELWVRAAPVDGEQSLHFPVPEVGRLEALQARHDRRFFWVHTMPDLTVGGCLIVAGFVLLIWWRLPEEVLYGWFGVAALLWGLRTLTFVMESMPPERWAWWRLVYLASTGGFIIVMALFAARVAGLRSRRVERGLLAYWFVGPVWYLLGGVANDALVNRWWTAGLIPVGIATVAASFVGVWRQRTIASLWLPLALAVATLSGVHDYLIAWKPEALEPFLPGWPGQRLFLLHHGANLLLLAMGVMLSTRFVRSVRSLRELNDTLEARIADRERTLAGNFTRMAELERQHAAAQERQLIMREIHDGLGSKLFTSLSRAERGAMAAPEMAAALRDCISDMRLALDALAPEDHDLETAFGDFMFRWQGQLQAVGVRCEWAFDVDAGDARLPPHSTLQVLRVAQEALTNVGKHARATRVRLTLRARDGRLSLSIDDDGVGLDPAASGAGRGLRNMRARAEHLRGELAVVARPEGGTLLTLTAPLAAAP